MFVVPTAIVIASALLRTSPAPVAACPPTEEIVWSEAGRCVGETKRVVGRIDHVSRSRGGVLFLNFCAEWRTCPFNAVVFKDHAAGFADIARFSGAEVAVTGVIGTFRGRPQIVLDAREQLVIRTPVQRVHRPAASVAVTRVEVEPVEPVSMLDRIHASEAAEHVGERLRITGEVKGTERRGGDLVLSFGFGETSQAFVAVVLEPFVAELAPVVGSWVGRRIEIEGDVTLFDAVPGVFITDRAQVLVLGENRAKR